MGTCRREVFFIKKTGNLLYASMVRVLQQPWFYLCVAGITLLKFICAFSEETNFISIFVENNRTIGIFYLIDRYNWDAPSVTYLYYITVCLAAFPVIANYIQDEKNNRMSSLLPRAGYESYGVAQVFTAFIGSFLCMFLGDNLLAAIGHWIIGLPFFHTSPWESSDFLESGRYVAWWLLRELQYGLNASFLAVLSLAVSFVVRDTQFVTILPMILQFFFIFPWQQLMNIGCPAWLQPMYIYMMNVWTPQGYWSDTAQIVYVVVFTLIVGVLVSWLFCRMLRRRMRG